MIKKHFSDPFWEKVTLSYLSSKHLAFGEKFEFLDEDALSFECKEKIKDTKILMMGSGNGSNFEELILKLSPYQVQFLGLFCDNPQASIIKRAKKLNIPVTYPRSKLKKKQLNERVEKFLSPPFDLVVLAGYMRILPPDIVRPLLGKIINIHPSLLPDFRGLNAVQRAINANVEYIGVSVHLIDEDIDQGTLLSQAKFPLAKVKKRDIMQAIHSVEHRLYFDTILRLLSKQA